MQDLEFSTIFVVAGGAAPSQKAVGELTPPDDFDPNPIFWWTIGGGCGGDIGDVNRQG